MGEGAGGEGQGLTQAVCRLHGDCVEVAMVCKKTEKDGEYTLACKWGPQPFPGALISGL